MKRTILMTVLLLLVSTAFAEERLVPGEYPTIQAAIDDADDGDTVIVADGIYTGDGNRDIDFKGKAITVRSENGPEDCIIDCNGTPLDEHRGFYFHMEEEQSSVLDGITITNGYVNYGGGIYCHYSSPTITNCIITGNQAAGGGGGGICCDYSGNPTITNCTISGNQAAYSAGGGIYCHYSSPTITNCIITGNHAADGGGGGICCDYGGSPAVTNCTLIGNSASDGGGIYNQDNDLTLSNCTLSGNSADNIGGGIYNHPYSLTIMSNCIFWDNTDVSGTGQSAQIYGIPVGVIYSCIKDDDPDDSNIPFGGEENGNIDDNPMFVREPNDGGDGWGDDPETPDVNEAANDNFGDLHLQNGSPCINTGNSYFFAGPDDVDIDGQPRVIGLVVDMGVDEYGPIIVVTRPEGSEVWVSGSIHKIEWHSDLYEGAVEIWFSKDAGGNWQIVESNMAGTDSYIWHLPDIVDSNQCLIKIIPSPADSNVACIESGLFTIHPDNPDPAVESKWKTLGGDFKRSGLSDNSGPELGCVKWKFEVNGAVSTSVTIGVNGRVHIACEDGKLYTLDTNGVLLWSYDTNSAPAVAEPAMAGVERLLCSPTIGPDGTVYVGGEDGKLFAINASGELRWTHHTGSSIYSSPAVSPDGKIYVCSQDGIVYALASDGSELWSFETTGPAQLPGSIFASPAIGNDGTVYIAGLFDPNLYALNPNDGSIKWVRNFEFLYDGYEEWRGIKVGLPFASPVIAEDGTIYQTVLYDPNFYAINPNDGTIIWSKYIGGYCGWLEGCLASYYYYYPHHSIQECLEEAAEQDGCEDLRNYLEEYSDSTGWSEPALGPDGTIYVSFDDPYLRAIDPNGSFKWVTRLGTVGGFTLTVGDDGLIYAASDDGYLCVVNPDGQEIARFNSGRGLNFPVISADNTLIIADWQDDTVLISDTNNVVWAIGSGDCNDQVLILHRPQDLDGSRAVNFIDFALLATDWLKCTDDIFDPNTLEWLCGYEFDEIYLAGDIDRNLYVDFADLAAFADKWLMGLAILP
jgi:parallel beta-helix repeat protein